MAYTAIDKPSDYFNTKLYTGNGGTQSITGVGFAPNWSWIKNRTSAEGSGVFDTVRGVTKMLCSQNTDGESTTANSLTAFGSDGFSIGANNRVNQNSNNIVSWNWKGGTSFTNDASSTGIGTIDSAGSVNQDAGFSIVSYTGTASNATVGHGLGATPKMMIIKNRSAGEGWAVYHQGIGNTNYLLLNTTAASVATAGYFNNTTPTSTVFSVGTEVKTNGDGNAMIAYCFAEKQGYSKFGSYTGNGNADGTFVYTGFAPAFFILKRTDATEQWLIKDNKRPGYNPNNTLYANLNNAEDTGSSVYGDFVSNGVKLRGTYNGMNASGGSYIYMAFASNPFTTSSGVPATAR